MINAVRQTTRCLSPSRLKYIMAPIPPVYDPTAASAAASIQRRIIDVREHQIPRLRDCKESLAVQQQYNAELQEDLENLGRLVDVRG